MNNIPVLLEQRQLLWSQLLNNNNHINMNNILQAKIFTQTPASAEKDTSKKSIYSEFQLPISYLDANYKHALSDVVSSDLELNSNSTDTNMYEHLLKPKHKFATDMI